MSITRSAYANLELQPIAGQWRAGSTGRPLDVFDPYSQERLLTITLASREDLDEAYRKAREEILRESGGNSLRLRENFRSSPPLN